MNYDNIIDNQQISLPLRKLLKEANQNNINLFLLRDFNGITCTFKKTNETKELIKQIHAKFIKETTLSSTFYFDLACLRDLFTTNILSNEKFRNSKWCIFQQLEKYSINNDEAVKTVFKLLNPNIKYDLTFKVLVSEMTKIMQEKVIKYNAFNIQKTKDNHFMIIKSLNFNDDKNKLYNEVFYPTKNN